MIPDVMQLLTFNSVCPASTATSAERSFSHLRCIKSYLRNTMSQQRLVSLMLLSAYPEITHRITHRRRPHQDGSASRVCRQ